MRFIKKLLLWLIVLVMILAGVGFLLPANVHVERSVTIMRPASEVFAVINSFKRFNDWSPWFDLDPQAKYTYTGAVAGVGAKTAWTSNKKEVGSGSQEIVQSEPNKLVKVQLDFGEMGRPLAFYTLTPMEKEVKLVWGFDANMGNNPIGRYFGLMMDSMIGKDYEKGLAKLKTLVESFPDADISGVNGELVELRSQAILYVTGSSSSDPQAIAVALGAAYGQIGEIMTANSITQAGAPLAITRSYDANNWKFDAAIPVDRNDIPTSNVRAGNTYAGNALLFTHTGPYAQLGDAIVKAQAWAVVQGYKTKDRLIEEFVSDPGNTPPEQLVTRIKIPIE